MKDLLLTLLHLAVMTAKLCGPGGVRAVIAENLLLKQQLIVLRRPRQRAPNLTVSDRLLCGFWSLFLSPGRIRKVAIGVRLCWRIRKNLRNRSMFLSLEPESSATL
jgi:putative transposase